jgi:hydroxymethylbilane synthase
MEDKKILVGTRGSRLALIQTDWVISELKKINPTLTIDRKIISTKGDEILNVALDKIGDKGLFVKEIETQLLEGHIDLAVHSMKDMPSQCVTGLSFSNPPPREDPRDALILKKGYTSLDDLPENAKIGTGSKRRAFQLKTLRPDIETVPIRGNVETRISKIESENLDGVILAAAGLHRLGLKHLITDYLTPEQMIPAPAQGALCLQYRTEDKEIKGLLQALSDDLTTLCIKAERRFLEAVDGSCHIPIGAYATLEGDDITLKCVFGDAEGDLLLFHDARGSKDNPEAVGDQAAAAIKLTLEKEAQS